MRARLRRRVRLRARLRVRLRLRVRVRVMERVGVRESLVVVCSGGAPFLVSCMIGLCGSFLFTWGVVRSGG